MIQLGLSARDRRTAVFGVTSVALLIGLSRGLPALRSWEDRRVAEATDVVARAASARASVRMLPVLRDTLRARKTRLDAIDSTLLSGASAAAAAAQLASLLDHLAMSARFTVTTMQLRADSAAPGSIVRVAVRVVGASDVRGLAAFLRAVEGNETPLAVRELNVTQPEPAAPNSKPEALRIDVLVEALARIYARRT